MPHNCPPRELLLWYLHGKTSETETESIESHIQGCARCQALVEVLAEEPDSLMQRIAEVAQARIVAGGPGGESASPEIRDAKNMLQGGSSPCHSGYELSSKLMGGYQVLECIGEGGMGSVYRARDVRLDKLVALKILKPDRMGSHEAISRFEREMKLLAQLKHGNIVEAICGGEQDGRLYFAMELVGGINLHQLVRRLGPIPQSYTCHIASLAASALQYAHDSKVIHRDVKPSNLMLTPDGNVKLLDLGLAQILEMDGVDALSRADQLLGTLAYMSPEQLAGRQQITLRSDIYGLGVTLHELLTGQRPSGRPGLPPRASDIQTMRPDVDLALIALVADMLAVVPTKRPSSMSEVETRLRAIAPPASLSELVADYYRGTSRGVPAVASEFGRADTEASAALSTASQSSLAASSSDNPLVASPALTPRKPTSFMRRVQTIALAGCFAAMGWLGLASFREQPSD